MLAMALPRHLDCDMISVLSHVGDGAVEPTWPWCLSSRLGHGVMSLPSYAGDGAVEATWSWCDVSTELCW
jgi:hypothetical protein